MPGDSSLWLEPADQAAAEMASAALPFDEGGSGCPSDGDDLPVWSFVGFEHLCIFWCLGVEFADEFLLIVSGEFEFFFGVLS